MKWWYLRSIDSLEYALVYAYNRKEAFKKLKDKRNIGETDYKGWKIEELNKNNYDGILYFS